MHLSFENPKYANKQTKHSLETPSSETKLCDQSLHVLPLIFYANTNVCVHTYAYICSVIRNAICYTLFSFLFSQNALGGPSLSAHSSAWFFSSTMGQHSYLKRHVLYLPILPCRTSGLLPAWELPQKQSPSPSPSVTHSFLPQHLSFTQQRSFSFSNAPHWALLCMASPCGIILSGRRCERGRPPRPSAPIPPRPGASSAPEAQQASLRAFPQRSGGEPSSPTFCRLSEGPLGCILGQQVSPAPTLGLPRPLLALPKPDPPCPHLGV